MNVFYRAQYLYLNIFYVKWRYINFYIIVEDSNFHFEHEKWWRKEIHNLEIWYHNKPGKTLRLSFFNCTFWNFVMSVLFEKIHIIKKF